MFSRRFSVLVIVVMLVSLSWAWPVGAAPAAESQTSAQIYYVMVDSVRGHLLVDWTEWNTRGLGSQWLSVVEIDSGRTLRTLAIPSSGGPVAFHPGTDDAYVQVGKEVHHLNLATGELQKIADLSGDPTLRSIVLNPTTSKVYVYQPDSSVEKTGNTLVIDEKTRTPVASIPYVIVAVDSDANRLYAQQIVTVDSKPATRLAVRLFALDGDTDLPVSDNPILEGQYGWPFGTSVQINRLTGKVYVVTGVSYMGGPTTLDIVDRDTGRVLWSGPSPVHSIAALSEREDKLYGIFPKGPHDAYARTRVVDAETLAEAGVWPLDGEVDGVDEARNLVVIIPNFLEHDTATVLLADAHNDTIQRRIVISPPYDKPAAIDPVAPFTNSGGRTFFPQTGHSLSGAFKDFWERNGGLAVFGLPITEEFEDSRALGVLNSPPMRETVTVQYFERARLEFRPKLAGTPKEVQLGLLGRRMAALRSPVPDTGSDEQYAYFPETGQYLSYGFKYYWEHNGGSAIFGLPITGEFSEVNPIDGKTYTVQYFERARFEYHPEFKGTPYETELGLVGVQTLENQGWR